MRDFTVYTYQYMALWGFHIATIGPELLTALIYVSLSIRCINVSSHSQVSKISEH